MYIIKRFSLDIFFRHLSIRHYGLVIPHCVLAEKLW